MKIKNLLSILLILTLTLFSCQEEQVKIEEPFKAEKTNDEILIDSIKNKQIKTVKIEKQITKPIVEKNIPEDSLSNSLTIVKTGKYLPELLSTSDTSTINFWIEKKGLEIIFKEGYAGWDCCHPCLGNTIDHILLNNRHDLLKHLFDKGLKFKSPPSNNISIEVAQMMINEFPDKKQKKQFTFELFKNILFSYGENKIPTLKFLIKEHKVDINKIPPETIFKLFNTDICTHNIQMIPFLLKHGLNPNIRNEQGINLADSIISLNLYGDVTQYSIFNEKMSLIEESQRHGVSFEKFMTKDKAIDFSNLINENFDTLFTSKFHPKNSILYNWTKESILLKEFPNHNSKTIDTISSNNALEYINKTNFQIVKVGFNNGVYRKTKHNWIKIKFNNKVGYVINYALLPLKPSTNRQCFYEYLTDTLRYKFKTQTQGSDKSPYSHTIQKLITRTYENGIIYKSIIYEKEGGSEIFLPNLDLFESLIFFTNCFHKDQNYSQSSILDRLHFDRFKKNEIFIADEGCYYKFKFENGSTTIETICGC